MRRVLVTRHQPEAEETASRLRRNGLEPLLSPVRRVIPLTVPIWPADVDAVVVTSRNALHDRLGIPGNMLGKPVFCVGNRTAETARLAGFQTVIAGEGDAGSLIATIVGEAPAGARLLYLAGEPRRETVESGLMRHGFHLVTSLAYRMEIMEGLTPDAAAALRAGTLAAVLHFSAESAHDFLDLAARDGLGPEAARLEQFCLSATVAAAIEARGVAKSRIRIAEKPDQANLIALLRTQLTT